MSSYKLAQNRNIPTFLSSGFAILLALSTLALPVGVANESHDLGSQMVLEYYYRFGWRAGIDYIQNSGPLGFLSYPSVYGGFAVWEKVAFHIIFALSYGGLSAWFWVRFPDLLFRILFISVLLIFGFDYETRVYFLFLMVTWLVFDQSPHGAGLAARLAPMPLIAVLALTKLVFLFCSIPVIGVAVAREISKHRYRTAAAYFVSFLIPFFALWLAAGQSIGELPAFLLSSLEFSNLFNDAMTVFEPVEFTFLGGTLLLLVAARLMWLLYQGAMTYRWDVAAFSVVAGFVTFVVWKHSFVRADGHMLRFFHFIALSVPLLFLAPLALSGPVGRCFVYQRHTVGLVALGLAWAALVGLGYGPRTDVVGRVLGGIKSLASLQERMKGLEAALEEQKRREILPNIKKIVGDASIDNFGIEPGRMVLGSFNYQPRPMPIRFVGLGPTFSERNAAFYRSDATAPQFVLMTDGTIDGRFLPQDDALAQLELLAKYQPVAIENHSILFERRKGSGFDTVVSPISQAKVGFGQSIPIPVRKGDYLWSCVDIQPSLLASLLRVAYKIPAISIQLDYDSGRSRTYKFIPVKGGTCFLIRPVISNNSEFMAKMLSRQGLAYLPGARSEDQKEPTSMKFTVSGGHESMYTSTLHVSFSSVSGLLKQGDLDRIFAQSLSFNVLPSRVEALDFRPLRSEGRPVVLAHAPSMIDFQKEVGIRHFYTEFGLLPVTYQDGATNGVIFTVRFTSAVGGPPRTLYERTLDPRVNPADRGFQSVSIDLPADEVGTLSVGFDIRGDGAWDQTFLSATKLLP